MTFRKSRRSTEKRNRNRKKTCGKNSPYRVTQVWKMVSPKIEYFWVRGSTSMRVDNIPPPCEVSYCPDPLTTKLSLTKTAVFKSLPEKMNFSSNESSHNEKKCEIIHFEKSHFCKDLSPVGDLISQLKSSTSRTSSRCFFVACRANFHFTEIYGIWNSFGIRARKAPRCSHERQLFDLGLVAEKNENFVKSKLIK